MNIIRKIILKINLTTLVLGAVSFLTNLSTSLIMSNMIAYASIINSNINTLILYKTIGNIFGYFSKIFISFFSDLTKKRKIFLLYGYGLGLLTRPFFILSSLSFLDYYLRDTFYSMANLVDKVSNSARDGIRDSILITTNNSEEQNRLTIGFRRVCSYFGTLLGAILSYLFLRYTFNNYTVLYSISMVIAIFSFIILVKYLNDNLYMPPVTQNKKSGEGIKVFLMNFFKESTLAFWIFLIGIFFIYAGKVDELYLWKAAVHGQEHSGILFFGTYYLVSGLSASIFSLNFFRKINSIFLIIIGLCFLIFSNIIIIYKSSWTIILISNICLGFFTGTIETLTTVSLFSIFKTEKYKAFVIGILNSTYGLGYLTYAIIFKKFYHNYMISLSISVGNILLGLVLILLAFFLNKSKKE